MIKKLTLILLLSVSFTVSNAQNWFNSAGGNSNDESYDIEVDGLGYSYTTGYVTGATIFSSTINLTTNGSSDVYVAKSDPSGSFVWAKTFGGQAADRGNDIALDAQGNIYITGFFNGSAQFDNITLTSAGNSQDIFIAKLDNNGNVLWAIAQGGSSGDIGHGIAIDNQGNVIVTGQFKETATIGTNTFTSAIDPNTGLYSSDFFVAKYSAAGTPIWSLNGFAEYDDRGLAVTVDNSNNILVGGQFSDTLVFAGTTINNGIYNAGMVFKLDPNGGLTWFKRLGATQTLAYDLKTDDLGNVFVTGDFKGQMVVFDTQNFYLNGNYSYRIFVLKMDASGHVIWGTSESSGSEVSSKAIALDNSGGIYISGTFKCVFDDYADTLGNGYFNSVGYRDVFITKYNDLGVRQYMHQFGGPKDDFCSGIAVFQVDEPLISGSFDNYFNFPYNNGFSLSISGFLFLNNSNGYTDSNFPCYGNNNYRYLKAIKSKDIFVGNPYNSQLHHYNYYMNDQGLSCYEYQEPCFKTIGNTLCHDSIEKCEKERVYYWSHTVGNGISPAHCQPQMMNGYNQYNHHYGPYWNFDWFNAPNLDYLDVIATDDKIIKWSRLDGCKHGLDTINVIIHPLPLFPYLSDSKGFNTTYYPIDSLYNTISFCYTDSVLLAFANTTPSDSMVITFPDGTTYHNQNLFFANLEGIYMVDMYSQFGCTSNALLYIKHEHDTKDTINPYLAMIGAVNDSITICYRDTLFVYVMDSITNPNGFNFTQNNYFMSHVYMEDWNTNINSLCNHYNGTIVYPNYYECIHTYSIPSNSGWYTFSVDFILGYNNSCGTDTTHYHSEKMFYVTVNMPPPEPPIILDGEVQFCPGDTVNVWTNMTHPDFSWNGPDILFFSPNLDSLFTITPGKYTYNGYLVDSVTGCGEGYFNSIHILVKQAPVLTSNVPDNIICPYDSILLTAPNAIGYLWYGPQGTLIDTTQSIYAHEAGYYHCVVTDYSYCPMTSESIELKEYSSPYIVAEPDTELCHSGAIDLFIEHSGSPTFVWINPAGLNSPNITVTDAGVYMCTINQCGFTVTDSITITDANLTATITALSPLQICEGETVSLMGDANMMAYEWSNGAGYGMYADITEPGMYAITITNNSGCTATSDSVQISFFSGSAAPIAADVSVCIGNPALLTASANNSITWYDANYQPIGYGATFTTDTLYADTQFYVTNSDTNCTSEFVEVMASIYVSSLLPVISISDTLLCEGDSFTLSNTLTSVTHLWTFPDGSTISNTSTLVFNNANSLQNGTYTLQVNDNNCMSPVNAIDITFNSNPSWQLIPSDTLICPSDSVVLSAQTDGVLTWYEGTTLLGQGNTVMVSDSGIVTIIATSLEGCTSQENVLVNYFAIPILPAIPDTVICLGEDFMFDLNLGGNGFWWIDSTIVMQSDSIVLIGLGASTLIEYASITVDGCHTANYSFEVMVNNAQISPQITATDTVFCIGDNGSLSETSTTFNDHQWILPNQTVSLGASLNLNPVIEGWYGLTAQVGNCVTDTAFIYLTVHPYPVAPTLTSSSLTYCEGDSILITAQNWLDSNSYWIDPNQNVSNNQQIEIQNGLVSHSGTYTAINSFYGCETAASIDITVFENPTLNGVGGDYAYCIGDSISLLLNSNSDNSLTILFNGNPFSNANELNFNPINLSNEGSYTIEVVDQNSCQFHDTLNIQVDEYPIVNLQDTTLCNGVIFTYIVAPGYDSYYWHDGSTLNKYLVTDSGFVYVYVTNGACQLVDSAYVTIEDCTPANANIFTPNGDGVNDTYHFITGKLKEGTIVIVNRWGKVVYEKSTDDLSWDGKHYLTQQELEVGVYYYVIQGEQMNGTPYEKTGFIQLMR
jgi:gliding motility-associated-like protein